MSSAKSGWWRAIWRTSTDNSSLIFGTRLVKEKNLALAVLLGAMSIGLCIIIAAAVH